MAAARSDYVRAVQGAVERAEREAQMVVQLAEVLADDPWSLRLLETGGDLHDDQITLTQWARWYDAEHGIDPGDLVLVVRKRSEDGTIWLVTDVVSDKEM